MRSPPGLERIFLLLKHDTISVPFLFIKDNANRLRTVAHFINFKKTFRNGIIYKYKNCSKYHEQKLGLSRNTIKKQISLFIELGWAEKKGELIFLKGKKYLAQTTRNKLTYTKIDLSQDILSQLKYKLVKSKINQVNYRITTKEALSKSIRKKLRRIFKGSFTSVSCKTIAKIFNCSRSTASLILKKLVSTDFLEVIKSEKEFITFCTSEGWKHRESWWNLPVKHTSCYFYKGVIYSNLPNKYKPLV